MIRLDRVSKQYDNGQVAVQELTLRIESGETCMLVGPSGCGKTTTLKMINRLIQPTGGRIFINDVDVTDTDPVELRRSMGYVIQQVGLFPHLTVGQNIACVPRLVGWDRKRVRARVDELLELVGLEPALYRDRFPSQVSGGQRQRVGVARALGADPPILIMDEPFGAVDRVARDRLQHEFLEIQRRMRKTVVFVTHDIDEAVRLGDRIAIFKEGGVLQQYDPPARLLGAPATPFVAEFLGPERATRRLSVTPIELGWLEPIPGHEKAPVVPAGSSLAEALNLMLLKDVDTVLVVDGERPLGSLSVRRLFKAAGEAAQDP